MIGIVVWAVYGLVVGALIGWILRTVRITRAGVQLLNEKVDTLMPETPRKDERGSVRLPHLGGRDVVMIVMVLVMLWAAVQSQITSNQLRKQNAVIAQQTKARAASLRCLSTWAENFATALDARTNASISTQQGAHDTAIDDVQLAVLAAIKSGKDPAKDPDLAQKLATFQEATTALDLAREKNKQATASNPYPDPPSNCIS